MKPPLRIHFDNYAFAEQVCSIALVFIMFYGGFGTNINEAKPVAVKAVLLSSLVNFFDGATGLMQMLLFFLLGLLSFPSQLPSIALSALFIALFITFIARPAAVFMILSPFKSKMRQQMLVSWTGLRGAASIVFAIMTVVSPAFMSNDIFHIVFFIVLFSILIQGSLIPFLSKKLDMTDENSDVMKTFTDYTEELPISFIQFTIREGHEWADKQVKDIVLPPESIFVLMIRNGEKIVPNGLTFLHEGDKIILSGISSEKVDGVQLFERVVVQGDKFADKKIKDISFDDGLLITICRDDKVLIPRGNTTLRANDILIINET